ncbi:FxsB family cyclophane-forming radical SAM/SPASM peptide maturase [Herbidospora mongoliensis]|uniref:FxsB family cyclophane-forming radical SAM/SPASM peptide maturase n=1 Tax=Herbidospora mongoliensis TaxID=688067 RepID=UPI000A95610A|nr:FxsB family cyclophane-forming radical SAM/SPASM peptide maturase [Herbidospora mongoliensis]
MWIAEAREVQCDRAKGTAITLSELGQPPFPESLDVDALLASGWRPHAFRQFILKIHSRCDLACRHCYVYEMADQGWKAQPRRMSETVVDHVAHRIGEHAMAHGLTEVDVILHGGEPLLAGPDFIAYAVRAIRRQMDTGSRVNVSIQTNGLQLDDTFLQLFERLGIHVGVSMDGYAEAHDRHRLFRDGRGSHAQVAESVRRISKGRYHELFSGLLCTIDVRNDPLRTFDALLAFDPPAIDFLLPHGNWSTPPPFRDPGSPATPYADWLIPIFDRWYGSSGTHTEIRLFTEILRLLSGRSSRSESIGLSPALLAVIETDGSIEQSDILKSAYHGAAATPLHVLRDPFDAALRLPSLVARQIGVDALSPTCRKCDIVAACGGGLYAHRYEENSGFFNPSVYCPDLYALVRHIHRIFAEDVVRMRGNS